MPRMLDKSYLRNDNYKNHSGPFGNQTLAKPGSLHIYMLMSITFSIPGFIIYSTFTGTIIHKIYIIKYLNYRLRPEIHLEIFT